MKQIFLLILLMLSFGRLHADEEERLEIENRIKPIGSVHIQGKTETTKAALVEEKTKKKELSGQDIYEQYCIICHKDGVANAPKFENEGDWKPRLSQAGSVDGLVAIAIKGLNVMPPKGTCQDCTDKDLKKAIEYMLPKP